MDGDRAELEHRLTELKDTLIAEYSLSMITSARWERYRKKFIETVYDIAEQMAEETEQIEIDELDNKLSNNTASTIMPSTIPVEPALLIVYAATDVNGEICRLRTLGGTHISTAGKSFIKNNSAREVARWQGALDNLVDWRWVKAAGSKGQVFRVTDSGYKMADMLKAEMEIDTNKDPLDELKEFDI